MLISSLAWTPAHGVPRAEPIDQAAAALTQPTEVGLVGPQRARAGTRVRYTCTVTLVGNNAEPKRNFILRLGDRGQTYWKSSPRPVPPARQDIFTPRLPPGIYNATCTFNADPDSIFEDAKSGSRQVEVRRKRA